VYVGFVPAADWQPGQTPDQSKFVGTAFVPNATIVSGAFTKAITLPAGTVTDASQSWGVATFCAHACALTERSLDTFTPLTFAAAAGDNQQTITGVIPEPEPAGDFIWTIDGDDHAVALGAAVNKGSYLQLT